MKFKNLKVDLKKEIREKDKIGITKIKLYPRGVYDNYFEVIRNPFGNCQIFSISWFEYFLRDCLKEEFIENLKYCSSLVNNKKLLLIDISNLTFSILKKYLTDSGYVYEDLVVFTQPYISTNGSNMNIIQLNLTKIRNNGNKIKQ